MTTSFDPETGILYGGKYSLDGELIKAICATFHPVKVADLGCGEGAYCKVCSEHGCRADGYEGNSVACQNAVCDSIECVDLSKPAEPKDDYDLVLCLELGEHIPKRCQDVFIDNLARFSKDVLILSWAVPGQGGTGHVNCLSNETVIGLMRDKSFDFDKSMSEYLRQNSKLSWFKNTLMVFRRAYDIFDSSVRYSNHLDFMPRVVNHLGIKFMAEIGVLNGSLSGTILNKCPQVRTLYLIDPWQSFTSSCTQEILDKRYADVEVKMKQYGDRANILRLTSLEAAKLFEPESLDLVYIDANHSFKHVDEDIKAWWPKIRSTGYLAGHDIGDSRWPGVLKAVEANFGKQYLCGHPMTNWDGVWIVKKDAVE